MKQVRVKEDHTKDNLKKKIITKFQSQLIVHNERKKRLVIFFQAWFFTIWISNSLLVFNNDCDWRIYAGDSVKRNLKIYNSYQWLNYCWFRFLKYSYNSRWISLNFHSTIFYFPNSFHFGFSIFKTHCISSFKIFSYIQRCENGCLLFFLS